MVALGAVESAEPIAAVSTDVVVYAVLGRGFGGILVGIPYPVPTPGLVCLIGHSVWGVLFGILVSVLPTEIG